MSAHTGAGGGRPGGQSRRADRRGASCPTTSWLKGTLYPQHLGCSGRTPGLSAAHRGLCGQQGAALILNESQHPLTRTGVCGGSFQGLREEQPGLFRRGAEAALRQGPGPLLRAPLSSQHPAFMQLWRAAYWLEAVGLRPLGQTWSRSGLCRPWGPQGEGTASGSCYWPCTGFRWACFIPCTSPRWGGRPPPSRTWPRLHRAAF